MFLRHLKQSKIFFPSILYHGIKKSFSQVLLLAAINLQSSNVSEVRKCFEILENNPSSIYPDFLWISFDNFVWNSFINFPNSFFQFFVIFFDKFSSKYLYCKPSGHISTRINGFFPRSSAVNLLWKFRNRVGFHENFHKFFFLNDLAIANEIDCKFYL